MAGRPSWEAGSARVRRAGAVFGASNRRCAYQLLHKTEKSREKRNLAPTKAISMRSLQLFIATLAAASALRVGGAPRLQPRSSRVVLQQPPEATDGASPAGSETLPAEAIARAAEAASEPSGPSWPEPQAQAPAPVDAFARSAAGQELPPEEKSDPTKLLLYVSVPVLVLGLQLFFTFSRDTLSGDAVGPAVMDLWMP